MSISDVNEWYVRVWEQTQGEWDFTKNAPKPLPKIPSSNENVS